MPQPDHHLSRRRFLHTTAAGTTLAATAAAQPQTAAAQSATDDADDRAHFHHVHLNVTDPRRTLRYYQFMYGATQLRFRGVADALYTERSFILLNHVPAPPPTALESGIWHIGWGAVDLPNEFRWWKEQGMDVHTDIYPLGRGHVSYWNGPDGEVIELNTQGHHRFSHVHFLAADVNETATWYTRHLGLPGRPPVPKPADLSQVRAWVTAFNADNVNFIVYGRPDYTPSPPWWRWDPLTEFQPQAGRVIDHIAFSYRDIRPVYDRMKSDGVEVLTPIRHDPKFNLDSFYVLAPDQVTVEIVQAKPIPAGVWDT